MLSVQVTRSWFLSAGVAFFFVFGPLLAAEPVHLFSLRDVRLLDGPFLHAQTVNREYVMAHEVDRFLVPFRVEAGLPPKGEKYPNWESTGLDGHSAGHYLTALAQLVAAADDKEAEKRLALMVSELAECQRAHGDGYVGPIPGGKTFWRDVAAGRIQANAFSLNGKWVPWYNLHKLFAGLRDAWLIAGNAQSRDVLVGLSDWCIQLISGLSDEQMQTMLRAEHGGMNEVLADVYAITGDPKYLAAADRFSHRALLDPLIKTEDRLDGLHANTQIPKVIGFARIGELRHDPQLTGAARFFWDTVTKRRTIAFGGNSVREHFNPAQDFSSMVESREGPETCNTYNMLRLSEALFQAEPDAQFADYYERALFNHILSSQHPAHGGLVYFTPIRPRHYRVYSQPNQCFWCCVGSGMENHGKYGRFIYAQAGDALYVNLFIASELTWKERGLRLRQETSFPDASTTRLTVAVEQSQRFALHLRHPSWIAANAFKVRINGERWRGASSPSSYFVIDREWRDRDRVEIELPMETTVESLPDGSDYVALFHGPIVLAAKTGTEELDGLVAGDSRMGHAAPGRYLPLDEAPMLVAPRAELAGDIHPLSGRKMTFAAASAIRPERFRQLELVPFFRVHDARYMLYWRTATAETYEELTRSLAVKEKSRLALEARTLDQVQPGEQQPEVEHGFRGESSETGVHLGRSWRNAGAWFSYELKTAPGAPAELLVTYFAGEQKRAFDILINDQVIASVQLNGHEQDRFVDVAYPIPSSITSNATDGRLTIKFVAKEKSRVGSIYGVRLLKQAE